MKRASANAPGPDAPRRPPPSPRGRGAVKARMPSPSAARARSRASAPRPRRRGPAAVRGAPPRASSLHYPTSHGDPIEKLIDDLERSYTEVQERMSDPSVYNDQREAAEVGRRLKELETPYKLGAGVAGDPRRRRGVARRPRAEGARRRVGAAARRAGGGAEARARREGPCRRQGRDRRDPPGRRRRRGGDLGRRRAAHAHPLRREPRLQDRAALRERERERRLQGGRLRRQGRRRLLRLQVRGRHAPRPARPGDRVARAGSTPRRRPSR